MKANFKMLCLLELGKITFVLILLDSTLIHSDGISLPQTDHFVGLPLNSLIYFQIPAKVFIYLELCSVFKSGEQIHYLLNSNLAFTETALVLSKYNCFLHSNIKTFKKSMERTNITNSSVILILVEFWTFKLKLKLTTK